MYLTRRRFALGIACIAALNTVVPMAWGGETVRIVHAFSQQSPVHSRLKELVPSMEAAADYSARFEIYSTTEIGALNDLMFGFFEGQYDFVLGPANLFAAHRINVGPLARTDLFASFDRWRMFKGSTAETMVTSLFQKNDLELVGSTWLASEHLIASKSIHSIKDLKGMRVRVSWGKAEYSELLKALGAEPVKIRWSETHSALQKGTIDASVQAIGWTDTRILYGTGKTIVRNPVGGHVGWLVGRKDWREQMEPYTADLVVSAISNAMIGLGNQLESLEAAELKSLAKFGLNIAEFDEEDMQVLHDAVRNSWRKALNSEDRIIAEMIGGP